MKTRMFHIACIPMLTFCLLLTTTAQAQQIPSVPIQDDSAEAEAQNLLLTAHTIAIVDAGADEALPAKDANATRIFTADMKRWGRYKVVQDETKADVVLTLSSTNMPYNIPATEDTAAYTNLIPYLKLTIADAHTRVPLWTVTVRVLSGTRHGKDLYRMSVQNVVSQVKLLDDVQLTKQETSNLTYLQDVRKRAGWLALGITLAIVGGGIAGGILLKNKFDSSVAKQKQDGLDWCTANHVPLSECPANY